jgi:hypothetical protein
VVQPDGGDDAQDRLQRVGGVQAPAQTDFHHCPLGARFGKQQAAQRGHDLEKTGLGGLGVGPDAGQGG